MSVKIIGHVDLAKKVDSEPVKVQPILATPALIIKKRKPNMPVSYSNNDRLPNKISPNKNLFAAIDKLRNNGVMVDCEKSSIITDGVQLGLKLLGKMDFLLRHGFKRAEARR